MCPDGQHNDCRRSSGIGQHYCHRLKTRKLLGHLSREPTAAPFSQVPSRAATPAFPNMVLQAMEEAYLAYFVLRELAKKAVAFLNNIKCPNMHTALHYFVVTDYYGLSVTLAALLGKYT